MSARTAQAYRPLEEVRNRNWLSIAPLANLEFDRSALRAGELEIAGISFLDLEKFKSVSRRRWGAAGADLWSSFKRMFLVPYSSAGPRGPHIKAVAVMDARCRGMRLEEIFLDGVRDSLGILSSSLWVYRRRDPLTTFGSLDSVARGQRIWFFQDQNRHAPMTFGAMAWTTGLTPLLLDGYWIASERSHHFMKEANTFTDDATDVAHAWKTAVRRALRLFGEGYLQHNALQAMLADMITLDLLLFENSERQDKQIELLDCTLDWIRMWNPPGGKWANLEDLKRLLKIRNQLVHEGHCDDITVRELMLADDIVGNLLLLILRNTSAIKCKADLRTFAKTAMARRTLGRPTPMSFARRNRPVTHTSRKEERERILKRMSGLSDIG